MKGRIEHILQHYGVSSAQFADSIGVQRSSISHIISGRNKPSFDFIQKILLKYPEINAEWLLTGQGNTLKTDNTVQLEDTSPEVHPSKDLFTQNSEEQEDTSLIKSVISENSSKINEETVKTNTKVTNVNKLKSIILVYEDDTFKVLSGR